MDHLVFAPQTELIVEWGFDGIVNAFAGQFADASLDINGITMTFSQIPEPATLSLLGIGFAGLGVVAWRRRVRRG